MGLSPHNFFFGPFRLISEIDIPELHGVIGSGRLPVTIRSGNVPASISNAQPLGNWCSVSLNEYLLDIEGVARYYVGYGHDIRIQIIPGVALSDISTYLLGSVFGALCHQNGLLPLHASAVESSGIVTAFLGDSGAGKSTTAASLQRRGYPIVSDDICLLEPQSNSTEPSSIELEASMRVVPVAGWLKLWRQSLDHLGETPQEQNRTFSSDDKFRLYLSNQDPTPRRIRNLVFLERASIPTQLPTLHPLSASETIAAMMAKTYLSYVIELNRTQADLFRRCSAVLRDARGFRLTVPWGFHHIESVIDLVESTLLQPR